MNNLYINKKIAKFMNIEVDEFKEHHLVYSNFPIDDLRFFSPHGNWQDLLPIWFKITNDYDRGVEFKPIYNKFHVGIDRGDIAKCYEAVSEAIDFLINHNKWKV
jgi:hypothetical protein